MSQKIILQATFVWRTKDGSVKANDTDAVTKVYMISRDGFGKEATSDVTSACAVYQAKVDSSSGLHTVEVIHTVDLTENTKPVQYIICCRDTTANNHIFLAAKLPMPLPTTRPEIYLYPVKQQ